ncbi:MAG: fibronectin type III domain-containing protein [Ignavibacteria bacterium]|nr:fibronectin type III domain-containing protein [Ignavibacteria bacterium]
MISFSVPAQTAPNAPSGLNFTGITTTAMTLNWTDNSSDETGFPIYMSTDNVSFSYIGSAAANATSVGLINLTPGTLYYFQVYAANETKFTLQQQQEISQLKHHHHCQAIIQLMLHCRFHP